MNEVVRQSIEYVCHAPFFWGSMGFTVAIAMFIGALIYDGRLDRVSKGLVSVLSYGTMLLWSNLVRQSEDIVSVSGELHYKVYAGAVTIVAVSLAWIFGVILGVFILRCAGYKER